MLESVSLNQNRFNAPGIAPDARGIVLGKQGLCLFTTLDSLVGFFRVLSDEMPLDDLLPSLAIHEVRSPLGSLAFGCVFQAESSYFLDRGARIAGLVGGTLFSGSGKHFVQYRDRRSPLGYDIDELSSEAGEFVLYAERYTQAYRSLRTIPFSQLVFRLSARRVPGGAEESAPRGRLYLAVAPGLAPSVLGYLVRNRVRVAAAMVEREGGRSAFGAAQGTFPARYLLARVEELPARMFELYSRVPGIFIYRQVCDQVIVEAGYRHPLRLEACRSVFEKDRFYIFSGRRDAVDVIAGAAGHAQGAGDDALLGLVDGERLVAVNFDLGRADPLAPARTAAPRSIIVPIRLVPSTSPPHRVTAALVGWDEAERLKRLIFALPPTVLAGCQVAAITDGLLIVGAGGVDGVPLGQPYYEAARSIFVPLDLTFLPRVTEASLAEHVGGVEGRKVVFRRGAERPIAVEDSAFEPLSRRVLGRMQVELREPSARAGAKRAAMEPTVTNDAVGLFPLWGYRADLPPRSED